MKSTREFLQEYEIAACGKDAEGLKRQRAIQNDVYGLFIDERISDEKMTTILRGFRKISKKHR